MRKLFTLLLALALALVCCPAGAESAEAAAPWGTPEEAALAARDMLLEAWKAEYADPRMPHRSGDLDIRSTRVFAIAEHPEVFMPDGSPMKAASMFDGMAYVVEFVVLTDYYGTGYPIITTGYNDHVILYRNGSGKVGTSPIRQYFGRTYSYDLDGIVTEITDLGGQLNGVWDLLGE